VFSKQLSRWQEFQRLQRYAREQNGYDYWRSEWEDSCKWHYLRSGEYRPIREGYYIDPEEEWKDQWQRILKKYSERGVVYVSGYRQWREFVQHTTNGSGFPEYVEALKERLAKHGFTGTFQLDKDLARQDKLTTWIEYLGYEYWLHDQYGPLKRRRQRIDEAWEELVDSNVLRPGETHEDLCGDAGFQRASEEENSKTAVRSAESAVSSAKRATSKSQKSRLPLQQLQQRLATAQSKLEAAKKRHESIMRRNDRISEYFLQTKSSRIAKREAEHHGKLLRWVLQQLSLIELELNAPNVIGNDTGQGDSGRKRKRAEGLDEERQPQRQRLNESDRRSIPDQRSQTVSTIHEDGRRLADKKERPVKRHKNNSRTPRLPDLPVPSHPTSDLPDVTKIRNLDPPQSATRPSKASPDQSSRFSQPLRRSERTIKRPNSKAIPSSAPIDNAGPRSRRLRC